MSFVVRHNSQYLHHNFVVALLNDLFGIQARGGCSCAGPYGHRLLGIDLDASQEFEREIVRGCEGIKPGWVRVNFNYFLSRGAVRVPARRDPPRRERGLAPPAPLPLRSRHRRLAPPRHRSRPGSCASPSVSYRTGKLAYRSRHATEPEWALPGYLDEARRILAATGDEYKTLRVDDPARTADFEELRWFLLPGEVLAELRGVV